MSFQMELRFNIKNNSLKLTATLPLNIQWLEDVSFRNTVNLLVSKYKKPSNNFQA